MALIYWLPFTAAALHVVEEFVWPGGFLAWHRSYRPDIAASITPRFVLIANTVLLTVALWLGVYGAGSEHGISVWLVLAALMAGNALFHLLWTWRTRRYSPGVVTGTLLYLPLCGWGYAHFLMNGAISRGDAITSFALGASYQFWSMWLHRRRGRALA